MGSEDVYKRQKHDVYLENTTVIVGVSGGPDSMLLLHELNKRRKDSFQLIAAHVDHMLSLIHISE
ncbi:ATP-binding protein, partial [Bacillus pumilus]